LGLETGDWRLETQMNDITDPRAALSELRARLDEARRFL
jgi:hypothetical protein